MRKFKYYAVTGNYETELHPVNTDSINLSVNKVGELWYDYQLSLESDFVLNRRSCDWSFLQFLRNMGRDNANYFFLRIKEDDNVVYTGLVNQQDLDFSEYKNIYRFKATAYNPYSILENKKSKTVNLMKLRQWVIQKPNSLFTGDFKACVKLTDVIEYIVSEALGTQYTLSSSLLQDSLFYGQTNRFNNLFITSTSNVIEAVLNDDYEQATKLEMSFDDLTRNLNALLNMKFSIDNGVFECRTMREIDTINSDSDIGIDLTDRSFFKYVQNIEQYKFDSIEIPNSEKFTYSVNQEDNFDDLLLEYELNKSLKDEENQTVYSIDWIADINGVASNPDKFPADEATIIQCYDSSLIGSGITYSPFIKELDFGGIQNYKFTGSYDQRGDSGVIPKFPDSQYTNEGRCEYVDPQSLLPDNSNFFGSVPWISENIALADGAKLSISAGVRWTTAEPFNVSDSKLPGILSGLPLVDSAVEASGLAGRDTSVDTHEVNLFYVACFIGSTTDTRQYSDQIGVYSDVVYWTNLNLSDTENLGKEAFTTSMIAGGDSVTGGNTVMHTLSESVITRNAEAGGNVLVFLTQQPSVKWKESPNSDYFVYCHDFKMEMSIASEQLLAVPNPDLRTNELVRNLHTDGRYMPEFIIGSDVIKANSTIKRKQGYEVAIPFKSIYQYDWRKLVKSKIGIDGQVEGGNYNFEKEILTLSLVYDSIKRPASENICTVFDTGGVTGAPNINHQSNVISISYDSSVDVSDLEILIEVSYRASYYLTGSDFTTTQRLVVTAENGDIRRYTIIATPIADIGFEMYMALSFGYQPIDLTGGTATFTSPGQTPETYTGSSTPSAWLSNHTFELIPVFISSSNYSAITGMVVTEASAEELDLRKFDNLNQLNINYLSVSRPNGFVFPRELKITGNSNVWTQLVVEGEFESFPNITGITGVCDGMQAGASNCNMKQIAMDDMIYQLAIKDWQSMTVSLANNLERISYRAEFINTITGGTFTTGNTYTDETRLISVECTDDVTPRFRLVNRGKYIFNVSGNYKYMQSTALAGQYLDTGIVFDPTSDYLEFNCRFDGLYQYTGISSNTASEVFLIGANSTTKILVQLGTKFTYVDVDDALAFHLYKFEGYKLYVDNVEVYDFSDSTINITGNFYVHGLNKTVPEPCIMSASYIRYGTIGDERETKLFGCNPNADDYYYEHIGGTYAPSVGASIISEISTFASDTTDANIEIENAHTRLIANNCTVNL